MGFRFFARHTAVRLDVRGYVKNLFDGRVEVYAIGAETQLESLLGELRRGPRGAGVDEVTVTDAELEPQFENDFSIENES